jgi:hypothetical protein
MQKSKIAIHPTAEARWLSGKRKGKGKLTPDQLRFHTGWQGRIEIARTIDEALKAVGL